MGVSAAAGSPSPANPTLVPIIFGMYVEDCLGARSIAMELNDRGHRTRSGRLWSPPPC